MNVIGDNTRDPAPEIIARLGSEYPTFPGTLPEFEAMAASLPTTVTSKEDHDACVDFIAKLRGRHKDVEATRVAEKDVYMRSERAVDGFFVPIRDGLSKLGNSVAERVTEYLRKIAAEERRKREEAAAQERAKAEAARRAQEEAERKAEEARRRDHRERATAKADDAAFLAQQHEERATTLEHQAAAKPAELARTRTDQGSLSTLKSVWVFDVTNANAVPLDILRPYIPAKEIEKAIAAFVKMGGRQLAGVRIYETEKGMIR